MCTYVYNVRVCMCVCVRACTCLFVFGLISVQFDDGGRKRFWVDCFIFMYLLNVCN